MSRAIRRRRRIPTTPRGIRTSRNPTPRDSAQDNDGCVRNSKDNAQGSRNCHAHTPREELRHMRHHGERR
jgi:hypothetical protein